MNELPVKPAIHSAFLERQVWKWTAGATCEWVVDESDDRRAGGAPKRRSINREGCRSGRTAASGRCCQGRPPSQTDPLTNVVSQTSQYSFDSYFLETSQSKLSQPEFLFDPGMGKFRNSRSLSIKLLPFGALHPDPKGL